MIEQREQINKLIIILNKFSHSKININNFILINDTEWKYNKYMFKLYSNYNIKFSYDNKNYYFNLTSKKYYSKSVFNNFISFLYGIIERKTFNTNLRTLRIGTNISINYSMYDDILYKYKTKPHYYYYQVEICYDSLNYYDTIEFDLNYENNKIKYYKYIYIDSNKLHYKPTLKNIKFINNFRLFN